jgi:hypothetical protein
VDSTLPTKELTCECGNKFVSQQRSNWCRSCGKQVYYDPKDQKKAKSSQIYMTVIIAASLGLVLYFIIEMIITPLINIYKP